MKYGFKDRALVIFESRESGKLVDYWINANTGIQTQIDDKLKCVVAQISNKNT